MKANALAKKFTVWSLLRFTLPTIVMMVFMSLYSMVDGIFVSRYVGTAALSAINIVFPFEGLVVAVGIMLATGASAVVSTQMGEGKNREAKENFTFITGVGIVFGIVIGVLGIAFLNPLLRMMGANETVWQYCYDYAFIMLLFTPCSILQMVFQYFFVVAGRPTLGLVVIAMGGVSNIIFDYVFIVPLGMGVAGAALATGIGFSVPAVFGLVFFAAKRDGLRFVKPKFRGRVLLKSCTNGSSEMVSNLSNAVVTLMYNLMMMRMMGEDGVAAITIVLYAEYLLTSIYLGYASGVAPVISYQHGNGDVRGLRHTYKTSLGFLAVSSLCMFGLAMVFRHQMVSIFAVPGTAVYDASVHGLTLFSINFLFTGFNIFASGMFTALNNGKVSAILSFLRTFVFIVAALALLPGVIGVDGVWLAVPLAEIASIALTAGFLKSKKKVYQYA